MVPGGRRQARLVRRQAGAGRGLLPVTADAGGLFGPIEAAGAELVAFCHDPAAGLRALVVLGSTRLGPALCGVRIHPYADAGAALDDGLRLAGAMTVKAAAAGVRLGGGSVLVLADPRTGKDGPLLDALGRQLAGFRGRVLAVNDVGSTAEDIAVLGARADVCAADPSPYTALGVVESVRAALRAREPGRSLSGAVVAVQGAGNVGSRVAGLLRQEGARVLVSDVDRGRADRVAAQWGARPVAPDDLLGAECDVLCPCALGGVITERSARSLRCGVVCGGANNILEHPGLEDVLRARGILYVPETLANAGGVIFIGQRALGNPEDAIRREVRRLGDTVTAVLADAASPAGGAGAAVARMARERLGR
jgi:leucine dehydrogenase